MSSATPLPLQQHRFLAHALRAIGQPATFHQIPLAEPVITVKRFGIVFASRGPIWKRNVSQSSKSAALRSSDLLLVNADKFEPDIYQNAGFRMMTTPVSVAEFDLNNTAAERLSKAKSKWRNTWRRAQHSALDIRQQQFDPKRHRWLLDADLAQQRKKEFRALPHAIIAAYAAQHPKDVIVFIAQQPQGPVAAMLFLLHHPVATYHVGWSNDVGRECCAHHRILFEAASVFSGEGYLRLDLGSVDTENLPNLARFKIGTGAVVRSLGGTWLRIPGL